MEPIETIELQQEEVEEGEGEEYHEVEQAEVEIAPPPEGVILQSFFFSLYIFHISEITGNKF